MNHKDKQENQLEQKLQHAKSISLSEEERERMSSFLSSYKELKPVQKEGAQGERTTLNIFLFRLMPAFVVVLFFVGGGLAMAQSSLPGHPLYGLKTAQEDVRGRLSFSVESKARWDAARVERRLAEARDLALSDSLSAKVSQQLSEELDSYAVSLEDNLSALKERDKSALALEIGSEYHSTLRVYKNLLSQLASESEEVAQFVAGIVVPGGSNSIAAAPRASALSEVAEVEEVAPMVGGVALAEEGVVSNEGGKAAPEVDAQQPAREGEVATMQFEGGAEVAALEEAGPSEAPEGEAVAMTLESQARVQTPDEVSGPTLETLRLFVTTRLEEVEIVLENSDVNDELKEKLLEQLESARSDYEFGLESFEYDDQVARSNFEDALTKIEDIRTILRIVEDVPAESVLESLLEDMPASVLKPLELELESLRSESDAGEQESKESGVQQKDDNSPLLEIRLDSETGVEVNL